MSHRYELATLGASNIVRDTPFSRRETAKIMQQDLNMLLGACQRLPYPARVPGESAWMKGRTETVEQSKDTVRPVPFDIDISWESI